MTTTDRERREARRRESGLETRVASCRKALNHLANFAMQVNEILLRRSRLRWVTRLRCDLSFEVPRTALTHLLATLIASPSGSPG
jgi:hypothetical protein